MKVFLSLIEVEGEDMNHKDLRSQGLAGMQFFISSKFHKLDRRKGI
jgi:hypothetical protein